MRWSLKIARIAGIEVRIHVTFLLFLAWIAFTYYQFGGAPAAKPPGRAAPLSANRGGPAVRTRTVRPWPTSRTTS